ncbi:TPA: 5-formyltetrahydrofolate cyclo-ligase [Streptococcus suis]
MVQAYKKRVRKQMLDYLSQLPKEVRLALEHQMAQKFIDLVLSSGVQHIAVYLSFHPELSSARLIQALWQADKTVYLPRILKNRAMEFVAYGPQTPLENVWRSLQQPVARKVMDPTDLDLVLVPGLAFTHEGYRIGFGGGYYDRLLGRYPQLNTVALASKAQIISSSGDWIESFDIPVKRIIYLDALE